MYFFLVKNWYVIKGKRAKCKKIEEDAWISVIRIELKIENIYFLSIKEMNKTGANNAAVDLGGDAPGAKELESKRSIDSSWENFNGISNKSVTI